MAEGEFCLWRMSAEFRDLGGEPREQGIET